MGPMVHFPILRFFSICLMLNVLTRDQEACIGPGNVFIRPLIYETLVFPCPITFVESAIRDRKPIRMIKLDLG